MTIKEIAKLAGVSTSTISKIVNNKDEHINPQTRKRVLEIVKEYNYTPYGAFKVTSPSKTFLIGVLLNHLNPSNHMINGFLQAAQAHGYSILLLDSQGDVKLELRHISTLCKNRIDGVIWEPVSADSVQYLHLFSDQDIPVCSIRNNYIEPCYLIDFVSLGYTLTQTLIDHRHTRIACLLQEGSPRSDLILQGYKKCLFDNQITFDPDMLLTDHFPTCCHQLIERKVTGIICAHFSSAIDLYSYLKRLHYSIPEDFSLASLKGDIADPYSSNLISGLPIPFYEFGTYVCEQLISQCETPENFAANYLFSPKVLTDSAISIDVPTHFRTKKILVVGNINIDFIFNVDHIPQRGTTTNILNSSSAIGGKGSNQAIGAARLGRQVSLIGEVGNDSYSSYIMSSLEGECVGTQGVHKDLTQPTGTGYIYIEKDGEGTITIQDGANNKLSPERIRSQQFLFENAGYCLLSTEIPIETVIEAAKTAKKHHVTTILKPSALTELPQELYKNIDILVPNQKEAATLCQDHRSLKEQADLLIEKGIPTIIITLGDKGCYLRASDSEQYFPPSDFVAVDTTGGADAFISALASYLVEGYPLEKAIRIATYAAGFCVSRQGVVPALIDNNTLKSHINRVEPGLL